MSELSRRDVVLGSLAFAAAGCVSHDPRAAAASPWDRVPEILTRITPPAFPERDFLLTDYRKKREQGDYTAAFAAAIAACSAGGGGRVVVPPGEWPTGPIVLKSNVNLCVEKGAMILFSTDPKAYLPPVFTRWEGVECLNYAPLVYAFGQENIAITGEGTLDGQADDDHWWPWKAIPAFGYQAGTPNQIPARNKLLDMAERGRPATAACFWSRLLSEAELHPTL